jgi:hypothetical protein
MEMHTHWDVLGQFMAMGFLHKIIAKASRVNIHGGQHAVYGVVANVNPKMKSATIARHFLYL